MDARFHQLVPRPLLVARDDAPSWLADPSVGRAVRRPLASILDVLAARLDPIDERRPVTSAVLIGLFEHRGEAAVLLTRRAATMRSEPLTVSFPGGRLEPGEGALAAALREAEEEVAIRPESVRVLGALPLASRGRDEERVLPVVGHLQGVLEARPNPTEVDALLEVPLRALVEEGAAWTERWGASPEAREIRFFAHAEVLGADLVWGLTARMLWQLIELLAEDDE